MSNTAMSTTGGAPRHAWVAETGTAMQLPVSILNSIVTNIRVVVHTMGQIQANPRSSNHWTIYLLLQAGESVQINFRVGAAGEDDRMTIEHRSYQLSNSAIKHWDFAGKNDATVYKFLQCIYTKDRDSYAMNSEGEGCHYWVLTVVSDFSEEGLCSAKSSSNEAIESLISYNYSLDQPAQAIRITRGDFIPRRAADRPTLPSLPQQALGDSARGRTLPPPAEQSSIYGPGRHQVQDSPPREVKGQRSNHQGTDGLLIELDKKKIFVPAEIWKKVKAGGKDALHCEKLKVYCVM